MIVMIGNRGKTPKRFKGSAGVVSIRTYCARRQLVRDGLAEWFMPYKTLEDAVKDLE
jgi:hypothetical protein